MSVPRHTLMNFAGQAQFVRTLAIQSAENSSTVIGHVEAKARSQGYKRWGAWKDKLDENITSAAVDSHEPTASCPLVQTAPMDPGAWPNNSREHIVLVLHSLLLQPCLLRQEHSSIQVFWNLLDSVVNAHSEATKEVGANKATIELGQAVIYNLSVGDPDKRCARVRAVV